jgi:hypothetical protein
MDKKGSVSQRWLQWAEARYAPDRNAVRIAYEAVLAAINRGENTEEIVIAADSAVRKLQSSNSDALDPSDIGISVDGTNHRGRVAGFQSRFESAKVLVWNFRLERTDAAGVALNPIAIEMRGIGFNGAIANGDIIEVRGTYKKGKILRVQYVKNLTSQVTVEARRGNPILSILKIIFTLIVLFFIIGIFIVIVSKILGFR